MTDSPSIESPTHQLPILLGVGGSHAHGLAHEDSDYDYRGVFSWPTEEFFKLTEPQESIVRDGKDGDDVSTHELKKWLKLATKGNPDVLELLGIQVYIEIEPEWGYRLIELQPSLLSTRAIRSAYMGYANAQFTALKKRGDSFSAGMGSRTWKHAKHMLRLIETGSRALRTGQILTQVDDPDWYLNDLPNLPVEAILDIADDWLTKIKNQPSVLPDAPDLVRVNQYLIDYRKAH